MVLFESTYSLGVAGVGEMGGEREVFASEGRERIGDK